MVICISKLRSSSRFSVQDVRPKIEKTVKLFLSKYYIRSDAVQSVQTMCDHVKEELKRFKFYRYRYVVSGTFQDFSLFTVEKYQIRVFQTLFQLRYLRNRPFGQINFNGI